MTNSKAEHNAADIRLGWGERLGYGLGGGALTMAFGIIGSFVMIYMTNVAFLKMGVISAILAVSAVLDGISDILAGYIVDHTRSKFGKARIWLIRMCLPFAVSTILLFRVPAGWPDITRYIYVFIVYNLTITFCFTFLQIAHFSLIPLMTTNREEQGLLSVIYAFFTNAAMLLGSAGFVQLLIRFSGVPGNQNTQQGYNLAIAVITAIMLLFLLVTILTTRERVHTPLNKAEAKGENTKRNAEAVKTILCDKYWLILILTQLLYLTSVQVLLSSGTYFALYRLNDMGHYSWMISTQILPGFVVHPFLPYIMSRVGKKQTYAAGLLLAVIGSAGLGITAPFIPGMIISNTIRGFGVGVTVALSLGLVADMVTYTSLKKGIFAAGLGNAGSSAANKIGQGVGSAAFGLLMASVGFNAQAARQPAPVITMVSWCYTWIPAIGFAAAFLLFTLCFHAEKELISLQNR